MSSAARSAADQYVDGDYASKHTDWHLADSPNKAADLQPALEVMLRDSPEQQHWNIADVGAGAGGVLNETVKRVKKLRPQAKVDGCGFEISAQAGAIAAEKFPQLQMGQKFSNHPMAHSTLSCLSTF